MIQPSLCRNFFSFGEHLLVKFYFISQHEANHILFTLYTLLIYSTHTQRYSYQSYIYRRFNIDGFIFYHTHTRVTAETYTFIQSSFCNFHIQFWIYTYMLMLRFVNKYILINNYLFKLFLQKEIIALTSYHSVSCPTFPKCYDNLIFHSSMLLTSHR